MRFSLTRMFQIPELLVMVDPKLTADVVVVAYRELSDPVHGGHVARM